MDLLLIGSGAREHAIAWKLSQSARVKSIFVAPGNGGTDRLVKCENIPIAADHFELLVQFARDRNIALTVVGPEAPLAGGIVDCFQDAGLPIFGPSRAAAQLEESKAFAKAFMARHGLPTAGAERFDGFADAWRYASGLDALPVIKASGLAAGKGVILPQTHEEMEAALRAMLVDGRFGHAGSMVLIEERLYGPELSVLAFCDGKSARIMPPAQDHKRLLDGDLGPNTGGMGAFVPSPLATPALIAEVEETILKPTLAGMAAEGAPYVGILYAGLILTTEGPKLLEFNCRFGDPEAQVILPLLESDLVEVMSACIEGKLDQIELSWRGGAATTVVMASGGYPDRYETGKPISGLDAAAQQGCLIFHAGTECSDGQLLTHGGRVLAVTALGETPADAAARAYAGIECIHFDGACYRRDIAQV